MESLLVADKTICLPCPSEDHYRECMEDGGVFRRFLLEMIAQHPELFPEKITEGFTLHGFTAPSEKQEGFRMRRIRLTGGETHQIRPSFMMPYMISKTGDVEKALFLCRFGVPFEALAYVFGRDAVFRYRAYISLGRNSVVGTTVKDPALLPQHLIADEKHTRISGEKAFVPTTVARECIPGVGLAENAGEAALTAGYSHFRQEALNLKPDYQPDTTNTDGWDPTQKAWKNLFPGVTLILCFLHAFLSIRDRCRREKDLFGAIKEKVRNIYHSRTPGQFSRRMRRFREWAQTIPADSVREKVSDLCRKAPQFKKSFSHPEAYRTGNAPDRLMNYQDRLLYSVQYFHGTRTGALLNLRAMALIRNFHPYGKRARHEGLGASPFEELNGFQYHPNWLQNMPVASSLGGWRATHRIR